MTPSECVIELIRKAAQTEKSEDAMRFSQAANNVANAMCAHAHAQSQSTTGQAVAGQS